jgi:hypothetical protein
MTWPEIFCKHRYDSGKSLRRFIGYNSASGLVASPSVRERREVRVHSPWSGVASLNPSP